MSRLNVLNDALSDVVSRTHESLVQVRSFHHRGMGSGVIVQADGLILTNAHVVRRQHHLNITLVSGETYSAHVVSVDKFNDLALLHIEADNLPVIEFADSENIASGQWVTASGHPWGHRRSATAGVLVGSGQHLPERPRHGQDWLAVNLHLRPGYSGGPLVDAQGKLLGINAIMNGPGVGLVIPAHVIRRFIDNSLNKKISATKNPDKAEI